MEALNKLHQTVTKAYKVNPSIKFEVFIHKVDGLSDDYKMETQRDIHQRANDDLADLGDSFNPQLIHKTNNLQFCNSLLHCRLRPNSSELPPDVDLRPQHI